MGDPRIKDSELKEGGAYTYITPGWLGQPQTVPTKIYKKCSLRPKKRIAVVSHNILIKVKLPLIS